jgi:CcmD family protein
MKVRTLALTGMLVAAPALSLGGSALRAAEGQQQPPPKPAATDEFVPVDKPMNAQDTIPAPKLVATAYGFIWVVVFGYVWSVRSRLATVEREIQTVSKRIGSGGR